MGEGVSDKIRIVVIDDHPIVCDGLTAIMNAQDDLEVCGVASRHDDALNLIDQARPHVALLDISLQDCDGLDLLRIIKLRFPEVAVTILSVHDEEVYASRAIRAGASGYIMKGADVTCIMQAVRDVARGIFVFSHSVQRQLFWEQKRLGEKEDAVQVLTDRELAVFRLLGQGANTEQISSILRISAKTVETHRIHIKAKLHIDNLPKLVERAVSWLHSQQ